jgi:hypothetical protein
MILTKYIRSRYLTTVPMFNIGQRKREEALSQINESSSKIRTKQSVADVQKLQNYLHKNSTTSKNLNIEINRTAKYDKEFKEFLEQYKAKNRQYANIIDLSHYSKDQNLGSKTNQMR